MRIAHVRATPVNISFVAPYRFGYGSLASVTKTIVEVESDTGMVGLGEVMMVQTGLSNGPFIGSACATSPSQQRI